MLLLFFSCLHCMDFINTGKFIFSGIYITRHFALMSKTLHFQLLLLNHISPLLNIFLNFSLNGFLSVPHVIRQFSASYSLETCPLCKKRALLFVNLIKNSVRNTSCDYFPGNRDVCEEKNT